VDLVPDYVSAVLFGEGAGREEPGLYCDPAGWVVICGDVCFGLADSDGAGVVQEQGEASGGVAAAPVGGVCPVGDVG
jgi:hypothetical protein